MPLSSLDIAVLKDDIQGESVAEAPRCDYCGDSIAVDQPVEYDVIRIANLPNLEQLVNPPAGWFADALRCQDCNRDQITPATNGFDEALVMVTLSESERGYSIDTSSFTVVDVSLENDGYEPPMVDPRRVAQYQDMGLARWLRVKWLLEHDDGSTASIASIREGAKRSQDIPPSVEELLSDR